MQSATSPSTKVESTRRITDLLVAWSNGDRASLDALCPLIYHELRRIAAARLRRERHHHTLQVTGLVHEAFLRLIDQNAGWRSKTHFLAIASEMMRRVLLDYARRQGAAKRGEGAKPIALDDALAPAVALDPNLLLIDDALTRLADFDAQAAKVVEMRFFGGLTNEEIASALELSTASVQRNWMWAKAWLHHEIRQDRK